MTRMNRMGRDTVAAPINVCQYIIRSVPKTSRTAAPLHHKAVPTLFLAPQTHTEA